MAWSTSSFSISGDTAALKAFACNHSGLNAVEVSSSIREMVKPGLLAVAAPVAVGFIGGAQMLGGLLAGVTATGVLMALFQSNAGGAWDNAKKMIEEG